MTSICANELQADSAIAALPTVPAILGRSPSDLRSSLAQIKSKIARLEMEQREVEDSLAHVVFPVLTLPTEITSRIFVECLPSKGHVFPSPFAAPLLLAQICGHWRQIAIATTQLWSSIDVSLFPSEAAGLLLETWFSRAKARPLLLAVRGKTGTILSFISAFAPQLQQLDLDILDSHLERLELIPHFPNLLRLATTMVDEKVQSFLENSPSIRELRLVAWTHSISIHVPSSLTGLKIACSITTRTFLEILTTLPLLSHLDCSPTEEDVGPITPITLPHLTSLTLRMSSPFEQHIESSLNFITAANLQRLEVFAESATNIVLSFIERSSCSVSHLALNISERDETEIIRCLERVPSVVRLELVVCDLNATLGCFKSTPAMLPQMTAFQITTDSPPVDYDLLVDVLRYKMIPSYKHYARIQSFRLIFHEDKTDDNPPNPWYPGQIVTSALEEIMADGLDFSLGCSVTRESWPPEYDSQGWEDADDFWRESFYQF